MKQHPVPSVSWKIPSFANCQVQKHFSLVVEQDCRMKQDRFPCQLVWKDKADCPIERYSFGLTRVVYVMIQLLHWWCLVLCCVEIRLWFYRNVVEECQISRWIIWITNCVLSPPISYMINYITSLFRMKSLTPRTSSFNNTTELWIHITFLLADQSLSMLTCLHVSSHTTTCVCTRYLSVTTIANRPFPKGVVTVDQVGRGSVNFMKRWWLSWYNQRGRPNWFPRRQRET